LKLCDDGDDDDNNNNSNLVHRSCCFAHTISSDSSLAAGINVMHAVLRSSLWVLKLHSGIVGLVDCTAMILFTSRNRACVRLRAVMVLESSSGRNDLKASIVGPDYNDVG